MALFFTASEPLTIFETIESVVERLLKEVPQDSHTVEVEVFLNGMSNPVFSNRLQVSAGDTLHPIKFSPPSTENLSGWVRLTYLKGNFESSPSRRRRELTVETLMDILD